VWPWRGVRVVERQVTCHCFGFKHITGQRHACHKASIVVCSYEVYVDQQRPKYPHKVGSIQSQYFISTADRRICCVLVVLCWRLSHDYDYCELECDSVSLAKTAGITVVLNVHAHQRLCSASSTDLSDKLLHHRWTVLPVSSSIHMDCSALFCSARSSTVGLEFKTGLEILETREVFERKPKKAYKSCNLVGTNWTYYGSRQKVYSRCVWLLKCLLLVHFIVWYIEGLRINGIELALNSWGKRPCRQAPVSCCTFSNWTGLGNGQRHVGLCHSQVIHFTGNVGYRLPTLNLLDLSSVCAAVSECAVIVGRPMLNALSGELALSRWTFVTRHLLDFKFVYCDPGWVAWCLPGCILLFTVSSSINISFIRCISALCVTDTVTVNVCSATAQACSWYTYRSAVQLLST